jgi:hypothetical protein
MKRYQAFLLITVPAILLLLSFIYWYEILASNKKDMRDMYLSSYGLKGDGTLRGDEGYALRLSNYWKEILLLYCIPLLYVLVTYVLFCRYKNLSWTIVNTVTILCGIGFAALYFVKVW